MRTIYELLAVFCLCSVAAKAEQNDVYVGGHRVLFEPKGSMGVIGALNQRFFRISSTEQFSAPIEWRWLGIDLSVISVAYKDEGNGPYVSLNTVVPIVATVAGYVVPHDAASDSVLNYWGLGPAGTLLLLPQLVSNWSLRMDLRPRVFGMTIGPVTDIWAGRSLAIHTELKSELYLNIAKIGLRTGASYNVIEQCDKWHIGMSRIF